MKLFITNKEYFENTIGDDSKEIHKKTFNKLRDSIQDHKIPLYIFTLDSAFEFKKVIDDVYFYEFTGTAS